MERKRSWPAGWRGQGVSMGCDGGGGGERTGVPDLEADNRVGVGVDDALGHEARADGRRDLVGLEGAFAVAHDQRRLADALGAEDDDLGLKRRHCCPFVVGVWGKEVEQKATERLCWVGCARLVSLRPVRGGLVEVGAVGRTNKRLSGCQRFSEGRGDLTEVVPCLELLVFWQRAAGVTGDARLEARVMRESGRQTHYICSADALKISKRPGPVHSPTARPAVTCAAVLCLRGAFQSVQGCCVLFSPCLAPKKKAPVAESQLVPRRRLSS